MSLTNWQDSAALIAPEYWKKWEEPTFTNLSVFHSGDDLQISIDVRNILSRKIGIQISS